MPDSEGRLLQLRDVSLTPPGGWAVVVPQTKMPVAGGNLRTLVVAVVKHLQANNMPVPTPPDVWVEDLICTRLPVAMVKLRGGNQSAFVSVLSKAAPKSESGCLRATLAVLHRARAMMQAKGVANAPVDTGVAEARSSVCRACPEMATEPGCYSCSVKSALDPWTGFFGVDSPALGVCHRDGVFLKALVRSSANPCILRTPDIVFPTTCWRMKDEDDANTPAPAP